VWCAATRSAAFGKEKHDGSRFEESFCSIEAVSF
jgi:hypothetical protein